MPDEHDLERPSIRALWWIWAAIGIQSFGGGASTQLLIRRAFVERRSWVGSDELLHFWNLCQFTPGINIIALTILIGRKLGGKRGIAASLAGLLVPSAGVTCGLAAGFEVVQHSPAIQAILRGVIPATAGIMAVVAWNFARPVLYAARKEGLSALSLSVLLLLGSALVLILLRFSVVVVILGVALLGAMIFTPWRARAAPNGDSRAGSESSA
ncbi:MAG TPA: chromate transporter [Chloroflexota bacterium]|jgi:chromate transporter